MSQVTILRRDPYVHYPGPGEVVDVVDVTFSSDLYGPSSVLLSAASYRPATSDELAANPRYRMLPVDKKAEEAERKAIADAVEREATSAPHVFELP